MIEHFRKLEGPLWDNFDDFVIACTEGNYMQADAVAKDFQNPGFNSALNACERAARPEAAAEWEPW